MNFKSIFNYEYVSGHCSDHIQLDIRLLMNFSKTNPNRKWRRLHNEEIHSLYRSLNIVRVIKSRRLRWAGHAARIEEGRSAFKILTGTPAGKRPL